MTFLLLCSYTASHCLSFSGSSSSSSFSSSSFSSFSLLPDCSPWPFFSFVAVLLFMVSFSFLMTFFLLCNYITLTAFLHLCRHTVLWPASNLLHGLSVLLFACLLDAS
ncbi:hypothetical protein QOT17_000319 [Balamuthia mandrillaris]